MRPNHFVDKLMWMSLCIGGAPQEDVNEWPLRGHNAPTTGRRAELGDRYREMR
jgi:hypothetical protein